MCPILRSEHGEEAVAAIALDATYRFGRSWKCLECMWFSPELGTVPNLPNHFWLDLGPLSGTTIVTCHTHCRRSSLTSLQGLCTSLRNTPQCANDTARRNLLTATLSVGMPWRNITPQCHHSCCGSSPTRTSIIRINNPYKTAIRVLKLSVLVL